MKKPFLLGPFLVLLALLVWNAYDVNYNMPHGKWTSWRLLYSESEGKVINVIRFENGWFRDLNDTGNPFDQRRPADYVRCSPIILDEIKKDE